MSLSSIIGNKSATKIGCNGVIMNKLCRLSNKIIKKTYPKNNEISFLFIKPRVYLSINHYFTTNFLVVILPFSFILAI